MPPYLARAVAGELMKALGAIPTKPTEAIPLGDPALGLLSWLQHATRDGRTLPAGSVVTTGAWRVQLGLKPGDRAVARFDGLGAVEVGL